MTALPASPGRRSSERTGRLGRLPKPDAGPFLRRADDFYAGGFESSTKGIKPTRSRCFSPRDLSTVSSHHTKGLPESRSKLAIIASGVGIGSAPSSDYRCRMTAFRERLVNRAGLSFCQSTGCQTSAGKGILRIDYNPDRSGDQLIRRHHRTPRSPPSGASCGLLDRLMSGDQEAGTRSSRYQR